VGKAVLCGDADTMLCEVGVPGEGSVLEAGAAVLVGVGPVLKGMLVVDGLCTGPAIGPPELGAEMGGIEEVGAATGEDVAGADETGEAGDGLGESIGLAGACDISPDT
jgi:hypothetical protein